MIYTIGETVLDIVFKNHVPKTSKVGGSALNSAVSLARMGAEVQFVSEVGDDEIGQHSIEFLHKQAVGTHYIQQYAGVKTSIALAFLDAKNNASYSFYKQLPPFYTAPVIDFFTADYVLFSSSFALQNRSHSALMHIVDSARQAGAICMYDPNIRAAIHEDSRQHSCFLHNVAASHIVRASHEDLHAVFPQFSYKQWYDYCSRKGVQILIITQADAPVELFTPSEHIIFKTPSIPAISTIGAGDTFNAAVLFALQYYAIQAHALPLVSGDIWTNIIEFAQFSASQVCMSMENYVDAEVSREAIQRFL